MARISLNVDQETFDKAGSGFELLKGGTYEATFYEVEEQEGTFEENKGLPQANIQFRISEGELDSDGKDMGNRRIFHTVPLHMVKNRKGEEVAPWQLIQIVKALGGDSETLKNVDTDDWVGEAVKIEVTEVVKKEKVGGEWVDRADGEKKNKIKSVRSVESAEKAEGAKAKAKSSGFTF